MRDKLVETKAEIIDNVNTFLDGIYSNSDDKEDFRKMVKRGVDFYPIQNGYNFDFAPSRFIGYANNDLENHRLLKKDIKNNNTSVGGRKTTTADGRKTTTAINKVLDPKAIHNEFLKSELVAFGNRIGTKIDNRKHKFWTSPTVRRSIKSLKSLDSAVDDINDSEVGNNSPEYIRRMAGSYVRDPEVRRQVLSRANGVCEYEGCVPFMNINGQLYLEAHHIISLAEQGEDKISNVIALCPNHHREAHFGEKWESLQDEFKKILERLNQ
ncbi:hypothetical protein LPB140_07470 [Sphingorhabdus lutea]|uniref:HNH nuclease domain-containing protein n=1 Tax=Sphingorhabdus lutea TaxID=1913578 RepID=A0A1L3JC64_9SPHN|nr:HNH endonuclease [Sphingorhabdus lutea]APG62653.1 hypothetical protein LPB140_07470 [Sphingorhabdus lutea]